jgi:hypothetical protein
MMEEEIVLVRTSVFVVAVSDRLEVVALVVTAMEEATIVSRLFP